MKRKKVITTILIITVCILPIVCILMIHHFSLCSTLQKMENGNFGKSSSMLKMSENTVESRQCLFDELKEQEIACGIYLDDINDVNKKIRFLAYTQKYVDLPMVNGRFLEKTDFVSNKCVAVIGKKVQGVYQKSGKKYIKIYNREYEVVGVMGYEEDTKFDKYVFANLFACEQEDLNIYSLDFFADVDRRQVLQLCSRKLEKIGCELEIMVEVENFSETLTVDFSTIGYFVCLLLSYVICIWLISFQWLEVQRREMCIRRLVGASKKSVIGNVLLRYIGVLLISFLVGYLYCIMLYPSYKTSFYYGYFISSSILLVFMIVTMFVIKNDSVEEAIKK
ncbi:MAG: ABC transporter permease [Lachnospiraceae bacterium]|nr:ABC transporter permease [Lachnospiraceae bacterium]